jgi:hypothetical protein
MTAWTAAWAVPCCLMHLGPPTNHASTAHWPCRSPLASVCTALHDSGSASLLPAMMWSLRSVSGILTSPPQQDKRARSGSLRLHFAQTKGGEQFGIDWGETRNPPGPGKSRPGSRFPPRPPFLPPRKATVVPAALMTVEGASKTSAHDRGRCPGCRASRGSLHTAPCCRARKPASKYSGRRMRTPSSVLVPCLGRDRGASTPHVRPPPGKPP